MEVGVIGSTGFGRSDDNAVAIVMIDATGSVSALGSRSGNKLAGQACLSRYW